MFEGLEKIGCSGTNWFIKKETKTTLILVKMYKGNDTPIEIEIAFDSPYLSLPFPEQEKTVDSFKRKVSGEPILIPFDWNKIEELTNSSGTRKRKIKY